MVYRLFLILSVLLTFCCSDDNDGFLEVALIGCGVDNPLKELEWLRSEVEKRKNDSSEEARYCYISQFEQDGQTYFLYEDCNPFIDKVIPVYNCLGENVGFVSDANFPFQIFMERTIIFNPENTLCDLSEN